MILRYGSRRQSAQNMVICVAAGVPEPLAALSRPEGDCLAGTNDAAAR